jgi:hypothetical protein
MPTLILIARLLYSEPIFNHRQSRDPRVTYIPNNCFRETCEELFSINILIKLVKYQKLG